MACVHNFHLVGIDGIIENYVDKDICKQRVKEGRKAKFICDLCGFLKEVDIILVEKE